MSNNQTSKKILLIDVMCEARRAFNIIPEIADLEGRPINALVGFHNFLRRLLVDIPVDHCAAAWSCTGPTFRHVIFPDYKSHRSLPESLAEQKDLISRYLNSVGIPQYRSQTFEADDVLATLSTRLAQQGYGIVIDTIDKDICSLISESITIWNFRTKSLWGVKNVIQKFGVGPDVLPDFLALVGDSTDGIPGVPQVGPKKAAELLNRFGNAHQLLNRLGELAEKDRTKIQAAHELILRNLELIRLVKELSLDLQPILVPEVEMSELSARLSHVSELLKMRDTGFLFGTPRLRSTEVSVEKLLW